MTTNIEQKVIRASFEKFVIEQYKTYSPLAYQIYLKEDSYIKNIDHVAFRTFSNVPDHSLDYLEYFVTNFMGYHYTGFYDFPAKNVRAKSFSNIDVTSKIPRLFISELLVDNLQEEAQAIIKKLTAKVEPSRFPFCTVPWDIPSRKEYENLLATVGDYAAWVAVNGLLPNHMTVAVDGELSTTIDKLEKDGVIFSRTGGKIKGGQHVLLEQASTIADNTFIHHSEGNYNATSGYCEFAHRWEIPNTHYKFDGFIEPSADKIFESTKISGNE